MDREIEDLVIRARQRDAGAFAALIERFERATLATAYGVLHDADRAGDAVQEGFMRAWAELPGLLDSARFAGWLMQIVRHAAVDMRRKIRPTVADFGEVSARGRSVAEEAEMADRAGRVKDALAALDETTREALMLRYYEGMATKEIADAMSMSPSAVDMRLSRGRAVLRENLGDLVEGDTGIRKVIGGAP